MMAIFSFWVLSSASAGIFSLGVGRRYEGELKTYALARAAIPYVQKILEDDETPKRDGETEPMLLSQDLYQSQVVGTGSFEIYSIYPNRFTGYPDKTAGILDEERKLNINTIETDTLVRLFTIVGGLQLKVAEALADSVMDWRDVDNEKRAMGAEKFEYLLLKKPYECKNGPFESSEELLLVKGMTPAILKDIRPYVTVYGSGRVNINTATEKVLTVLGFNPSSVSGILNNRLGLDGLPGTDDDVVLANPKTIPAELAIFVSAEEANLMKSLIKKNLLGVVSDAFSFTTMGHLDSYDYTSQIDVVMKKDGEILAWRENAL